MNIYPDNLKPTIVVVAYNRRHSLNRLLNSLNSARYPSDDVRLMVSIDRGDNKDVLQCAQDFKWQHGTKVVEYQSTRLGVRDHVLKGGSLVEQFGSVIILEEDLFVSPFFYDYAVRSLGFYENDDRIAGISLYFSYLNEFALVPFLPLDDGSDVYFLQVASSWGQAWSQRQWSLFREWYDKKPSVDAVNGIPDQVLRWPDSSWKKHFIGYLMQCGKFFVYPRVSLTTNYSDAGGAHLRRATNLFQSPLLASDKPWRLIPLGESGAVYDAHFELHSGILKRRNAALASYEFEVDLNGSKNLTKLSKEYALTIQARGASEKSFGLNLKPIELNVVFDNPGDDLILVRKGELKLSLLQRVIAKYELFVYYYRSTSVRMYLLMIVMTIGRKVFGNTLHKKP
jgi:hypothetical protein